MLKKYQPIILFWFCLLVLALINATIRETTYKPLLEPYIVFWAHQLSSLSGIALFFVAIYLFLRRQRRNYTAKELWTMGSIWAGMTFIFELLMNLGLRHLAWSEIIRTYYFWQGETWIFVLLALLVSPIVAYRLQNK